MPRVSDVDRARIVGQLETGASSRTVALRFGIAPSTVSRIYRKFVETNNVKDRSRSGRPRCTTGREDRFICTSVSRDRRLTGWCLKIHFKNLKRPFCEISTKICHLQHN